MGKVIDSLKLNGEVELCLKEAVRQDNLEFEWIFGEPEKKELTKELLFFLKKKKVSKDTYIQILFLLSIGLIKNTTDQTIF